MLLALDTASQNFSLALFDRHQLLEHFVAKTANRQAEDLIPEIENLLTRHALEYLGLSYIAANIGPGSFTGLRIGLAAVRAWQLVLPVRAIAVSSLEAVALRKAGGIVRLDARRGQAFVQEFDANLQALSAATMVDYVGEFDLPADAEAIGLVALHKLATDADLGKISPLYIREADAKLPAKLL